LKRLGRRNSKQSEILNDSLVNKFNLNLLLVSSSTVAFVTGAVLLGLVLVSLEGVIIPMFLSLV